MPIASVTLAPQPASSLARIAGSPPPGSPATITRFTLDFARSLPRFARPFGEMQRVGRASSRRRSASEARPPRSAARYCPSRRECGRARAGRRRRAPRRRRRARRYRSRRCARRARCPRRRSSAPRCAPRRRDRRRSAEYSSAFRSCRWSNRCARSLRALRSDARRSARRRVRERAQLVLFGERQRRDRLEAADRAVRREAGALELVAIEARALEEIVDLLEIERIVAPRLLLPGRGSRSRARPSASGGSRRAAV